MAGLLAAVVILTVPTISSARLIEAPRDGAKVKGPTKVVVNVGRGSVYARLNGVPVERSFQRIAGGRRAVRVGAAEGLKPGRNALRVRRTIPNGGTKRAHVVFQVKRHRIAGIEVRGEHAAGVPLRLRAHGAPEFAWCLKDAPRRSDLKSTRCSRPRARSVRSVQPHRAASAKATGFDDLDARRTSFTPDVPGEYRVALSSGSGPSTSQDVYTVTAGPPTPLASLEVPTINFNGQQDEPISVDGTPYYPAPNPQGTTNQLQVVVLNRQTLTAVSNTTFTCAVAATCDAEVASKLTSDLAPLDDKSLVLVTPLSYVDPGGSASGSIGQKTLTALEGIGFDATVPFPESSRTTQGGPVFAAVGVPLTQPGEAWVLREFADEDAQAPHLTGALTRVDDNENFGPVATDYVPLTVRLPPSPCGDPGCVELSSENTMTIGETSQTDSLPENGAIGGFQIVVLDGVTREVLAHEVAVTNPASASTVQQALAAVNAQIRAGDPGVVLVASLGEAGQQAPQMPGDFSDLANFVQEHGGTAHAVLSMGMGEVETYEMAGQTNSGPAGGFESGPAAITPAGADPEPGAAGGLIGSLARNGDDWRFVPSVGEVVDPRIDLMQTVYQSPTPWPDFDANAMAYIAGELHLGADVRDAYWSEAQTKDWDATQTDIKELDYPDPAPTPYFSPDAFTDLRGELFTETGWMAKAQAYLYSSDSSIGSPFSATGEPGLKSWSDIQNIGDTIYDTLQKPSGTVNVSWLTVLGDVAAVAGALVDPGIDLVGASLLSAGDMASFDSGTSVGEDQFQTAASDFGSALQQRLVMLQTSYARMLQIVASDYGKLKTVGTYAGCLPATDPDPGCPAGWQWTDDMRDETGVQLQLWAERQAWVSLLPKAYGTSAFVGDYAPGQVTQALDYSCVDGNGKTYLPFSSVPASAQMEMFSAMRSDGPHHDLWVASDWGHGPGSEYATTWPTGKITDPLFASLDPSGDPTKGGLGLVPAHVFWELDPTPYNVLNGPYPAAGQCTLEQP